MNEATTPVNSSGLRPCGHAVLIELYEPELRKTTIVIPDTVSDRQTMLETRAIVIEAGAAAWDDEPVARARPGDKVMIQKYAGVIVKGTGDGRKYRLINDRDIICKIEVES